MLKGFSWPLRQHKVGQEVYRTPWWAANTAWIGGIEILDHMIVAGKQRFTFKGGRAHKGEIGKRKA
jgi:hypothetical protein